MQANLFEIVDKQLITLKNGEKMPNAEVWYYPAFFEEKESKNLFETLKNTIKWKHEEIKIFGKKVLQPRLTAFYGEEGVVYTYSHLTWQAERWNEALNFIKTRIETETQAKFNCVLLNFYRDGKDSMGWHSDDEQELGVNPVIASVSLGASRKFRFRHKQNHALKTELNLTNGSFLLMSGETQHFWQHELPKMQGIENERINLTFRNIKN